MAGEKKGLVARWLEGKERSEDYARSTLPTNRWSLFWDIIKGRFGRLMLVNLLMLLFFLPLIGLVTWRYLAVNTQMLLMPVSSAFAGAMPAVPNAIGLAEAAVFQSDLFFYALFIPAAVIAGVGISGGAYIIRNLIWTEGIFVANDFARGIKRNFLNVLEAVLLFTVFLFVARTMGNLADWYVAMGAPGSGWMIASKVIGYIFVAFALLVCLWIIALGINYKQGPWQLLRNSVVMTVGTFPQTIFFAAIALIPYLLVILGGMSLIGMIGIMIIALIGFSFSFLVWMDYAQWAFDRFINPNIGVAVGRGLYNKDAKKTDKPSPTAEMDSEALREYRRMIVAQGKSKLVCRPIKPIDDGLQVYQLPDSFSREDLQRLKESKQVIEDDVKAYEEEHKNDEQFLEYNKQFEEREKALQAEENGGKKKKVRPPKMLNKRK